MQHRTKDLKKKREKRKKKKPARFSGRGAKRTQRPERRNKNLLLSRRDPTTGSFLTFRPSCLSFPLSRSGTTCQAVGYLHASSKDAGAETFCCYFLHAQRGRKKREKKKSKLRLWWAKTDIPTPSVRSDQPRATTSW